MNPARLIAELEAFGVRVLSPGPDRLKLVAVSGHVPAAAVELARRHKPEILALIRTRDYTLPIVSDEILAAPREWCPQCQDALVLPELRGTTGGLCYRCSRKDDTASKPKGERCR